MRIALTLLLLGPLSFCVRAQSLDNKATDAYMITRMVAKFHVEPKPLDKIMSAAIYTQVLKALDDERIFFTQPDILKLSAWKYTLDDEIRNRKTGFLQLLTNIYQQRLTQADTI